MTAHLEDTQMLCCHCEEAVYRYALYCPYCQKSLTQAHEQTEVASENKVLPITTSTPFSELTENEQIDAEPAQISIRSSSLIKPVFTLLLLLTSSFFFFFGVLLRFFSENGVLVLQWNGTHWPYYIFPALVGIGIGYFFLYTLDATE